MMRERRNRPRTSSGVALVATSKSLGTRFKSKSRTAPPTTNAAKPLACKVSVTLNAQALIRSRDTPCALSGVTCTRDARLDLKIFPEKTRPMNFLIMKRGLYRGHKARLGPIAHRTQAASEQGFKVGLCQHLMCRAGACGARAIEQQRVRAHACGPQHIVQHNHHTVRRVSGQRGDQIEHVDLITQVEMLQRLVEQQITRRLRQQLRYAHALTLAA